MFSVLIGTLLLVLGLFFLWVALLGRNPDNISTTVGTLVKASSYKNVPLKYGGMIKNQTDYVYAYTVDGRTYRCTGRKNEHKRTLPRKVTIVYITRYPRSGCVERYNSTSAWLYAICCIANGLLFIGIYFLDKL